MKKLQYTTNDPSASTDYLAGDNTWKTIPGGGGGVPTTRNITINGTTQDLSADRTWTVGDMLTSTYDTDVDGVVDSAERIQIVVRNSTGSTLTKGQIVYLSGATGNRPNAVLAQANTEATSSKTIGMVVADIPNNTDGQIAVNGTLHDLDTSAFTAGDMLWLSATTAGGMVANTPPAEPNHSVFIGYVARSHPTFGRVVLAIQNGYELDELHGVEITSPTNGQTLTYNSTSGLWVNSTPSTPTSKSFLGTIIGFTMTAGQTVYGCFNYNSINASELGRVFVVPYACTVSNFYVRIFTAQPASGSIVYTVRKNFVDTAVVVTIAAGSAANTEANSGATSATYSAGDDMTFKAVNNASTTSANTHNVSIMVEI